MKSTTVCLNELDKEWIELIMEAKCIGLELATIREFIKENEVRELILEK